MTEGNNDNRLVYGAKCVWWDSISKVEKLPSGIPCCPHCRGVLFEVSNEAEYIDGAREYDKTHPGYFDLIMWMRGRCFPSIEAAKREFTKTTGKDAQL